MVPLMSTKVRLGLMGCAKIARKSFMPAVCQLDHLFEVTQIASRSKEKADSFARVFGGNAVDSYDALIESDDIDALYIPLPPGIRDEWIRKALACGKHVYSEKPLALSCNTSLDLVELSKKCNAALLEGYTFIHHPQHKLAQELLKDGSIGEIRVFTGQFGFPALSPQDFRYKMSVGGGVMGDAAGYPLRAALLYGGESIRPRSSYISSRESDNCSIWGSSTLQNNSGAIFNLSYCFDSAYRCTCDIWGSKGNLHLGHAFTPKADQDTEIIVSDIKGQKKILKISADNQFLGAAKYFYSLIMIDSLREQELNNIAAQARLTGQLLALQRAGAL